MKITRILVCGGRDYKDKQEVYSVLDDLLRKYGKIIVIQGEAKGADLLAKQWAADRKLEHEDFLADWKQYGKRAGYLRNKQMLDEGQPDLVVAFPGGRGTDMMVKLTISASVDVLDLRNKNANSDDLLQNIGW